MICASRIAFSVLSEMVARGLRHIVVAPGARSQSLALAARALEKFGLIQLTVRVDERVAAFTALGMAKALSVPAAVITTSGSAVANVYPAVVEGSHSFVPLVVITADRPRGLHGKRSNQTMNQKRFFTHWVRFFSHIDGPQQGEILQCEHHAELRHSASSEDAIKKVADTAWRAALGALPGLDSSPGPVHLNIAFDHPLSCLHDMQFIHTPNSPTGRNSGHTADNVTYIKIDRTRSSSSIAATGNAAYATAATADANTPPTTQNTLTAISNTTDPKLTEHLHHGANPCSSHCQLISAPAKRTETLILSKNDPPTVIIAGTDSGPYPAEIARITLWPLIAEISSGSRFGPSLVENYRQWLSENASCIERAIVFGHPTLSREIPHFLQRDNLHVITVAPFGCEFYNPSGAAHPVGGVTVDEHRFSASQSSGKGGYPEIAITSNNATLSGSGFHTQFSESHASQLKTDQDEFADKHQPKHQPKYHPTPTPPILPEGHTYNPSQLPPQPNTMACITRQSLVSAVWHATQENEILFFGSSRLIRVADAILPPKRVNVFANRGLSGIDGNLSTAAGIAIALGTTVRALVGDLTAVHDIGALLIPAMEKRYKLQVIIGNDFGGSIFDTLDISASPEDYERVLYVPCKPDFESAARAFGWRYTFCPNLDVLLTALELGESDATHNHPNSRDFPHLIEVHLET